MSATFNIKNLVYFTNATSDAYFTSDGAVFESATINVVVDTTDENTTVSATEILTQAGTAPDSTAISPECTFTIVITSTDSKLVANVNPQVSTTDIKVNSVGEESTDSAGNFVTTLTINVVKANSTETVYGETITDKKITSVQEPTYRYIILRHDLVDGTLHGNPGGDFNMTCQELYSLFNIACMKLSEGIYQTLKPSWHNEKIIELDEATATTGTNFFGEIRPVAKVWEANSSGYGNKTPVEITPDIVSKILTVMKSFAKEIIYSEYDRRYYALRDSSNLEAASWEIQKHEASEWLANQGQNGSKTPFLDYLSTQQNIDKTTLSNKILANAEAYADQLSQLLVDMKTLTNKFDACTTVWDINILYEDYFGISMPVKQAIDLGRTVSAENWNRKPEWRVKGNGYYF